MDLLAQIIDQVENFNEKFVSPVFKISDVFVFNPETRIEGLNTTYLGENYDNYHKSWKTPGVYIFLNSEGHPIYCGEASRHLWGRVYDYFSKRTAIPLSELQKKYSWDETPVAIILFYIDSDDPDDSGLGYALETSILNKVDLKFNKKKNYKG